MKLIIKSNDVIVYETDNPFEVQNAINNLNIMQAKKDEIRRKFARLSLAKLPNSAPNPNECDATGDTSRGEP